MKNKF